MNKYINDIIINITTCISIYFLYDKMYIFLLLISIDSISYANHFLIKSIMHNIVDQDKNIVNQNNKLYKPTLFERYLSYAVIYFFYNIIKLLILNKGAIFFKIFLCIISLPLIFNIIYCKYEYIFKHITEFRDNIIRIIISEQIYNILVKLNIKFFNNKIILNKNEIINELNKCKNIGKEINKFIKNTLIVFVMSYTNSKSFIYYKIIKYIYIYNTGSYYINNINLDDAKQQIIKIFETKSYNDINDPMTIHTLIYLYKHNSKCNLEDIQFFINYEIISFMSKDHYSDDISA